MICVPLRLGYRAHDIDIDKLKTFGEEGTGENGRLRVAVNLCALIDEARFVPPANIFLHSWPDDNSFLSSFNSRV